MAWSVILDSGPGQGKNHSESSFATIVESMSLSQTEKSQSSYVQHKWATFMRLVLLMLVLIVSVVENLVLLMLTLGPIGQWCRIRKEHKHFNHSASMLTRRQSEMCFYQAREVTIKKSQSLRINDEKRTPGQSRRFCHRCNHNHSNPFTTINCSTGRFTRYYFGNLCFANLLLGLLAMPYTLLACLGNGSEESDETEVKKPATSKGDHPSHAILNEANISYMYCTLIEFSVAALAMAMIICLVQLTADRLLAVCKPFHYLRFMTKRRALMNIVTGWLISIVMALAPHGWLIITQQKHSEEEVQMSDVFQCFIIGQHADDGHRYYVYAYVFVAYILPILFMFSAYVKMYTTAKRLSSNSHATLPQPQISLGKLKEQNEIQNNNLDATNSPKFNVINLKSLRKQVQLRDKKASDSSMKEANGKPNSSRAGEIKAAMRAFWLVATVLSLTLPYFCIMMRSAILTELHERSKSNSSDSTYFKSLTESQKDVEEVIRSVCVWLLYVNSTLTPGIYAYMDRVLRTRFVAVFKNPKKSLIDNRNNCCDKCERLQRRETKHDTEEDSLELASIEHSN